MLQHLVNERPLIALASSVAPMIQPVNPLESSPEPETMQVNGPGETEPSSQTSRVRRARSPPSEGYVASPSERSSK